MIFIIFEVAGRIERKVAKDLSRNCLALLKINAIYYSRSKRGTNSVK